MKIKENMECDVFIVRALMDLPGIEVLHGGHDACQEQYNIIPMGQNVHSNAKHFYCSWHATWPPCKTSIAFICRVNSNS